ncbi:small-conductance mechanosensitive channel [Methanolinea mesophila]|uniref:mechanosensitive ion channel family protein n=1 Tax=Methanolinea mesophila TaxID=547055 RepID=UPI001AE74046|nr:mechanosensitive ion channel domain-containing protein [Methanolinea mesophila]MBP1928138.1 small-conductance mechanosensitive channel [Methanolinea mesophila]
MGKIRLSARYVLLLILFFAVFFAIDVILEDVFFENVLATYIVALIVVVSYSIGAWVLVRKMPDEASRMTATRIFIAILLGLGFFLALTVWSEDPSQILITIGIIWGAILVALRDLIQNVVGSLMLLLTGVYRIGDHIRVKGVYGLVMDISVFRTTLMELDYDSNDRPTGEIITIPNGILFREVVTNTTRHLSIVTDEIRITVPFTTDIDRVRNLLIDAIQKYTGEIEEKAREELRNLGQRKYLPSLDTGPSFHLELTDRGTVLTVNYITSARDRSLVKTRIIEELSSDIPGVMSNDR